MNCDIGEVTERLENELSDLSVITPKSQLILQPFRRFTYVTAHSPTLLLFHLRHSSFSNPSFASPTSQALHLRQLVCRDHSPIFPSLHLRHNSFSNPSVALPTSELILQHFRCFTYVSSFSNPSFASPMSQALHLIHLASRPCVYVFVLKSVSVPWNLVRQTGWVKYLYSVDSGRSHNKLFWSCSTKNKLEKKTVVYLFLDWKKHLQWSSKAKLIDNECVYEIR